MPIIDLMEEMAGWRDTLETAMEHASHAWADLRRHGLVDEVLPPRWPPEVTNPVGSAAYHFAAMSMYVQRVYEQIVRICPEDDDEVDD